MDERIERYVAQAWKYYNEGLAELKEHPHKACESVWGAIDRMTRAVCLKYMGREEPPEGETWRDFLVKCFEKAGLRNADLLSETHRALRGVLHGECFYGGHHDYDEHPAMIKKDAKEYLETLHKVVKG